MNLLPPYSAHSISNRVMNWASFLVSIPVAADVGFSMDLIKLAAEIYRLVRMSFSQSLLSVNVWEQRDAEEST